MRESQPVKPRTTEYAVCENCMAAIYKPSTNPRLWFHMRTKYRRCYFPGDDLREAAPTRLDSDPA